MNQAEKICQSYLNVTRCFDTIPLRYKYDGSIDDDCAFVFPPGYSMYIEEFILNDPGPDNFVLDGETHIDYTSKLKWEDRIQTFWKYLDRENPLYKRANQRANRCIKTLKVTNVNLRDP